uniref:START domain-containing protein n=1 Tax=Globisporangium ultimum (strain ATCC 200006 / CBS 805.95 / DAOM BR144) TaxID=431595 RepID=K3WNS5_GLOUD
MEDTIKDVHLLSETQLKKLRRNERDRLRSLSKRESLKDMKMVVEELEAKKRELLVRRSGAEPVSYGTRNHVSLNRRTNAQDEVLKDDPTTASLVTPLSIQQDEFVSLTELIEQLRAENAALVRQLHERDLFNSAMQHLLLDFDKKDSTPHHSDDSDDGELHLQLHTLIGFTPLTQEEVRVFADQLLRQCRSARYEHLLRDKYSSGGKVFGWSDTRSQVGASITFLVTKRIANALPADMERVMWSCLTDSTRITRLLPPGLKCDIRVLQQVSENILIIDRRTYVGEPAATLRTVYMLLRVHDFEGGDIVIMKTIDSPLVKKLLLHDEVWCDIFYWMRFELIRSSNLNGKEFVETMTEFGGALSYVHEAHARAWLAELVFLAVRWETLAVSPVLLKAF